MAKSNKVNTINASRVLKIIWQNKQLSRIDISRLLNLDKSTVTKIISTLTEKNIINILNEGCASPQGGRKPIFLEINKNFGVVLGIEIQTRNFQAVGLNLHGDILFSLNQKLDLQQMNIVEAYFYILKELQDKINETNLPLLGIGIAMAGIIDPHKGIIHQSYPLEIFEPLNFYDKIKNRTDIPIIIENDANCGCYSELIHNDNRSKNFIFVQSELRNSQAKQGDSINMSIGIGIVIKEEIHHGDNYSAGEFRSVDWEHGSESQFKVSKYSLEIIPQLIDELGKNIAILVNSLNLTRVIISGELQKYEEYIINSFSKSVQKNWSYPSPANCEIVLSPLGDLAVAYGSAGMFIDQLFSLPDLETEEKEQENILKGIQLLDKICNINS